MHNTKNTKPKIALIGVYPPPYGGVSVGLQRLKEQLDKRGYDCIVYSRGKERKSFEKNIIRIRNTKRWFLRYLLTAREELIHYHGSGQAECMMSGLMVLRGKKTVISIGGEANFHKSLRKGSWFRKKLMLFALRHTSFIIAKSVNIRRICLSLGVTSERVKVIPGFIPPVVRPKEIREIPQEVWSFIDTHKPVMGY